MSGYCECMTCGHNDDAHGDWYGSPEKGCEWNDEHGYCQCDGFIKPAPKPRRWFLTPEMVKRRYSEACVSTDRGIRETLAPQYRRLLAISEKQALLDAVREGAPKEYRTFVEWIKDAEIYR